MTHQEIDDLVAARDAARRMKDYALADEIKARLLAVREGTAVTYRIALLDDAKGTFWYWTTRGI